MGGRRRIGLFAALVLVCVATGVIYLRHAQNRIASDRAAAPKVPVAEPSLLERYLAEEHIVFRDTVEGDSFGKLAVVPASRPQAPRAITDLDCSRVDVVPTAGICARTVPSMAMKHEAVILDSRLRPRLTVDLPGTPSRARLSPDGRYATVTSFVGGDSYAPGTFSTRTVIIDTKTGALVANLERLGVSDEGKLVTAIDRNYWGVTFAPDNDTFYATLATGGKLSMIKGSVKGGAAQVTTPGVECPSVSPDGTRIAYKKNLVGPLETPDWRIHVLDLRTGEDRALAEPRSVDDQVEWIDDKEVAYAIKANDRATTRGDPGEQKNVFTLRSDGGGEPKLLLELASSPSISGSAVRGVEAGVDGFHRVAPSTSVVRP